MYVWVYAPMYVSYVCIFVCNQTIIIIIEYTNPTSLRVCMLVCMYVCHQTTTTIIIIEYVNPMTSLREFIEHRHAASSGLVLLTNVITQHTNFIDRVVIFSPHAIIIMTHAMITNSFTSHYICWSWGYYESNVSLFTDIQTDIFCLNELHAKS